MTPQEINEQVARKLGWGQEDHAEDGEGPIPLWVNPRGEVDDLPAYSTSIEAAWEIVEKCPYFFLMKPLKSEKWKCDMGTPDNIIVLWADTAPRAIVEAFLALPEPKA